MGRAFRSSSLALALLGTVGLAQGQTSSGCVQVTNTTDISVTATVEGYSGYSWSVAPNMEIKFLVAGGQAVTIPAYANNRPPIHFDPGQIGMMWNYFTGADPNDLGCRDFWRIVVIRSPCSPVVDNVCR